jgi:hypothetical protein
MKNESDDPVIDEIRGIRQRISERYHDDPAQLVAHYIEFQEQFKDRLIRTTNETERRDQSAA